MEAYRAEDRPFYYTARPRAGEVKSFWIVGRMDGIPTLCYLFYEDAQYRQRCAGRERHGDYDYPIKTTRSQLREWWTADFDDGVYEIVQDRAELYDVVGEWWSASGGAFQ